MAGLIGAGLLGLALGMLIGFWMGKVDNKNDTRIAYRVRPNVRGNGEPISVDPVPKHARACDIIPGHIKRGGPISKDAYYEC